MLDVDLELRWEDRLRDDRERALLLLPPALAVALTGSTARGHRTAISDLDFHVIGPRPDLSGLPGEVDLVADSPARLQRRLVEGDDFIHWTVRLGCILHDPDGIFRDAYLQILRQDLWPDPQRKFERADALAILAERVLAIEDRDAAQEHVRAALTSFARGVLLARRIFPGARDELAGQLREAGQRKTAEWLRRSVHETLALGELRAALRSLRQTLDAQIRPPKGIGSLSEAA